MTVGKTLASVMDAETKRGGKEVASTPFTPPKKARAGAVASR